MLPPAKLTCTSKGLEGRVISLNGNLPLVIGRGETLDLGWGKKIQELTPGNIPETLLHPHYSSLPFSHISRTHALITQAKIPVGERYLVSDLDSMNGIYVNGERIEIWALTEGSIVSFGNPEKGGTSFRFSYER